MGTMTGQSSSVTDSRSNFLDEFEPNNESSLKNSGSILKVILYKFYKQNVPFF